MTRGTKRARGSDPSDTNHKVSCSLHSSEITPSSSRSIVASDDTPRKTKKAKLVTTLSPFPNHTFPTPQEASQVHSILMKAHPEYANRPRAPVEELGNSATSCGKVANVLDSLIGTILSQNTSAHNSTIAKNNLDATFGIHGFEAIAKAPLERVVDAIRSGGLANRKATVIQKILRSVHDRHGSYSLQHLSGSTDADAMAELISYDGVGPKTAACVLAFSLERDTFAVDTHVFRLSKMLGWVPPSANRVQAQAHLDACLPTSLKYELHVLMVAHGRVCGGCKPRAGARRASCVLRNYIRERVEEVIEETTAVVEDTVRRDVDTDHVSPAFTPETRAL